MNIIHPTAIVLTENIGHNNRIGPYCFIDRNVSLGDNNYFQSHCVIGGIAQHRSKESDHGRVRICDDNFFSSFVTVDRATEESTYIGNKNMFMHYAHVAHDCTILDRNTICNGAQLAGHVLVQSYVTIGLAACVHQHSCIGSGAFIAMQSSVAQHVPPYSKLIKNRIIGDNDHLIIKEGLTTAIVESKRNYFEKMVKERRHP